MKDFDHESHHTLLDLFDEMSFIEKVQRVIKGLRSPKSSGDYKYAKLQLTRLSSPTAAVAIPLLLLLLIIAIPGNIADKDNTPPVTIRKQPKELPKLDEKPEIKDISPEKDIVDMNEVLQKSLVNAPKETKPTDGPKGPPVDTPPQNVIMDNNSPLKLIGFGEPFGKDGIGEALRKKGGNGETESAVTNALRWLAMVQEDDGSWRQESGGGPGQGTAPAMTGLALLTFLAHGETHPNSPFIETVTKATRWLVENQLSDGNFKGKDNHNYSLPIAAYALCESYGLVANPNVKRAAQKSISLIVNGQNDSGGWDYNCKKSNRDDTSYMGWCAQAVKAAKIINLDVPGIGEAVTKSIAGFKKNANSTGGFGYTKPANSHLTSVGTLCLQVMGAQEDKAARQGLIWLEKATCDWDNPWGKDPLYYWYYVTQAKFHASQETWQAWNLQFAKELVNNQTIVKKAGPGGHDVGYWEACSETEHCKSRVYNTALCTLMLEVYYRELLLFKSEEAITKIMTDHSSPDDIEIIVINSEPSASYNG